MDQKCIESGYAYSSGNQIDLFEKCVVKICQPRIVNNARKVQLRDQPKLL